MPLRPDSRSDGKSGGLRPRSDTQLARLAEPVPPVPEMLTGTQASIQHSAEIGQAIALPTVQGTDLLLNRKKQDNIKSNGAVFHVSDSNCVAKLPVGVHKTGGHRSHPIPVRPPVVPSLKPKPPERTTSENSLPGSKEVAVPSLTPESKPEPSETIPSESSKTSKNKLCPAFAGSHPKVPEESATAFTDPASSPEVADVKPSTEAPKAKEGPLRSLASSSPRSSQLSLYLTPINERETGRTASPAPPIRTSLSNLIPPEERDYRRSPSPLHPVQSLQAAEYFLPIEKSPLKETTGKKSPLPDHLSTGKKSPLPDYIPSGYKSPLPECIVKNLVRQSSSRTNIPEVHEPGPSPSKPVKKECVYGDSRRPLTPVRPKSVAFAIDDEDIHIPPPPPPPKSVSKTLGICKAISCPGIIYSPRKDILIVKQPLAIIKPSVSPVGIKSTASGKIIVTRGGDIEAEVVSVVTAGGEVLSVVCEKQDSCAVDGNAGRTGLRSDLNSSLASLVGSSVRRSSVTSLSGSSLASLVVGGCCGGSEFGGLIIGDDIVVMGASGGAGAGAKGASGGSEAESCGGGACRKILSGRQQQQQATSVGQASKQPQQQQFQQPKGGGGPGPGPGGGGGTQVRDETSSKPSRSHSPSQHLRQFFLRLINYTTA